MTPAPSLGDRLRTIAANPTPAAIGELLPIATQVDRMTALLDEVVQDAFDMATQIYAEADTARRAQARRATRRRPHLVVVE